MATRWSLVGREIVSDDEVGNGVSVIVRTEWNREDNAWMAVDDNGNKIVGMPEHSVNRVALRGLAFRLGVISWKDIHEQTFDLDVATAMLRDVAEAPPGSPIKLNPMTPMLVRLARGVLRAHGAEDPTDGRVL